MDQAKSRDESRYWTLSRIAAATVSIVAIVGVALLMVRLASFLLLVFAAVVLAVVFDALTRLICTRLSVGRGIALALAVILLLGVFIGAIVLFGAQLTSEFDDIRNSLPGAVDNVQAFLDQLGLGNTVNGALEQGKDALSGLLSKAGSYLLAFGNGLTNLVLVIFAAVFLAADPSVYRRGLVLLVPDSGTEVAEAGLDDAWKGLNGWMKGQAISSVVVAALTSTGLALLGVPSAGGLGVIAGLLDVIPVSYTHLTLQTIYSV